MALTESANEQIELTTAAHDSSEELNHNDRDGQTSNITTYIDAKPNTNATHEIDNVTDASSIHSLSQQINALLVQKNAAETRQQYDPSSKPFKCRCSLKRVIEWGVPLTVLVLIIIAAASRTKRDRVSTDEILCEQTTLTSSHYRNQTQAFLPVCFTHENDGLSQYEAVPLAWKVVLSLVPFVCVFQGVLAYDLSSRYVAPFSLLVTIVLGLCFFEDEGWWVRQSGQQSNVVEVAGLVMLTIVDRAMWTVFEYAFNVFTSFFFLRVLELWGVVDTMRAEFEVMCNSDARKITLILFCFAIMIAIVAPGGSNFLIAGAIMVDMNHRTHEAGEVRDDCDKRIGSICLFGNGLTSAFNLVGVCIIAIAGDVIDLARDYGDPECATVAAEEGRSQEWAEKCAAKQIGGYFSLMFFVFSLLTPFVMAAMYSRKHTIMEKLRDMRHDWPVLLLCGVVYATVQFLCAWLVGPELVCLLAAGLALLAYYAFIQCTTFGRKMNGLPNFKKRKFALPFVLLIALLCCIRLIPHLQDVLEGGDNQRAAQILNPSVLNIAYLQYAFERKFGWLAHSGMTVLLVSVLTVFMVPYRELSDGADENLLHGDVKEKDSRKVKQGLQKDATKLRVIESLYVDDIGSKRRYVLTTAFRKSVGEALPVMLSIGSYAALAKVMAQFQMTQSIANAIVSVFGDAPGVYVAFMPFIGMLGSGLTGSTTTSNFLFGRLQVSTAYSLGLINDASGNTRNSVWKVAAVQILGATGGEIVSPMNAVFSTLLLASKFPESDLIKCVLKLFVVWMLGCVLVTYVFMYIHIALPVV